MVEVEKKVFETAKAQLVRLTEKTPYLTFTKEGSEWQYEALLRTVPENRYKLAYFFLQKLDYLINPLLREIVFIQRDDIDANYLLTSKYFGYINYCIRQALNSGLATEPIYDRLITSCHYPLEDYVKESTKDKQDIAYFAEQVYLVKGRIASDFFPDEVIIEPTKETKKLFDPIEIFLKEYKRQIEIADFAARAAAREVEGLFKQTDTKEITFDEGAAVFSVWGKSIEVDKFSDQYHTLRVIFADKDEIGKEWFYSEIAEKIDEYQRFPDKKFYNAIYQIKQKLKQQGIEDFFTTTRQSVRINPTYLG